MARGRNLMVAIVAMALWTPVQALAQVAQLDAWTGVSSTAPASTTINTTPVNITVSAGVNRVLLVAAVLETGTAGTLTNFNATLGGVALTPLASTETTSGRETVKVWYMTDAQVPAGSQPLVVTGAHTQTVSGLHVYWASYSSVDQANPVVNSGAAYNAATTVTFGSADQLSRQRQDVLCFREWGNGHRNGARDLRHGRQLHQQQQPLQCGGRYRGPCRRGQLRQRRRPSPGREALSVPPWLSHRSGRRRLA